MNNTLESPATLLERRSFTYNRLWSLTLEGHGIIAVSRLESTSTLSVDTVTCQQHSQLEQKYLYDMIHLLTAIGLSPGGSNTVHIYTPTIHRTIQNKQYIEQYNNWMSTGRALSWLVIPWHLPYNGGKNTEKPQSG